MTDETKSWHGGKPVGSQVATFGRTLSSEEKYKKTLSSDTKHFLQTQKWSLFQYYKNLHTSYMTHVKLKFTFGGKSQRKLIVHLNFCALFLKVKDNI